MLGTPPAFILSQDQTLNENGISLVFSALCCVALGRCGAQVPKYIPLLAPSAPCLWQKILREQVRQDKICLISSLKTNTFAFANSFWIIVFFKKLSRNFPLIRSLFTYQFADCFKMLVNFPLCFVAFGRIGTHVQKYTPFRSPSASRLSKNLLRIKIYLTKFLHYEIFKVQVQLGAEHLTY